MDIVEESTNRRPKGRIFISCLCLCLFAEAVLCSKGVCFSVSNMLENGGFEFESNNKKEIVGFRVARISSLKTGFNWGLVGDSHTGARSLRVYVNRPGKDTCVYVDAPELWAGEEGGRKFVMNWWAKRPHEGRGVRIIPQLFNREWSVGARTIETITYPKWANRHGWVKEGFLAEMSPGSNLSKIRLVLQTKVPESSILLDDFRFFEVTEWPKEKIDDEMIPSDLKMPTKDTDKTPFDGRNLLLNSSFELGPSGGWSVPRKSPIVQEKAFSSEEARFGNKSVVLSKTLGFSEIVSRAYVIRPMKNYTLSCWAKGSTNDCRIRLSVNSGYANDRGENQGYSKDIDLTNSWRQVSISGVLLPSAANAYYVKIQCVGNREGQVWIDGIQLNEGNLKAYKPRYSIEGSLKADQWPTNLYTWDERISVDALIVNQTTEKRDSKLVWKLIDFYGKTCGEGELAIRLEPKQKKTFSVGIPSCLRGSHHLLLFAGEEIISETTLTVVPPPRYKGLSASSPFGGHIGYDRLSILTAKRLGVKWNRNHDCTRITSWDMVEPEPGKWQWFDEDVDKMRKAGIQILGVLGRVPGWALSEVYRKRMPKGGWGRFQSFDAWKRYVKNVVRHYKGRIDYWEVWNEPFAFGINGDVEFYTRVFKAAWMAAKKGNPEAKIMGPSTSAFSVGFNEKFLGRGGGEMCDMFSFHHYTQDVSEKGSKSPARHARKIIHVGKEFGYKKIGVWLTEGGQGYVSSWHLSLPPNVVDNKFTRRVAPYGPLRSDLAAHCLGRYIPMMLTEGVEKVFHYWGPSREGGMSSAKPDGFTWFEYDGSLKPYAAVYAVSAYFLDGAEPAGMSFLADGVFAREFRRNDEWVFAVWSDSSDSVNIDIRSFPGFDAAYDMFGNSLDINSFQLEVGQDVVYWVCRRGFSGGRSNNVRSSVRLH